MTSPLRRVRTAGLLLSALLTVTLSGCSGAASTAPTTGDQGGGGRTGGAAGGRQPGVTGLVAAVSGRTLQVQDTAGQTAVTYTAKTAFTEVESASAKALKTGLCATVRVADPSTTGSTGAADQVTAASVTLSAATGGRCPLGFGGGRPGARPAGAPSAAAPSAPASARADAPPGTGRGSRGGVAGMGASGTVTSVSGGVFVVTSTVTVTTTATTTWEQLTDSSAKAVKVGRCVFATGTTSSTGAMTATALRLSKATNGTCTSNFGGPGRGGPGQTGGGQGNGNG